MNSVFFRAGENKHVQVGGKGAASANTIGNFQNVRAAENREKTQASWAKRMYGNQGSAKAPPPGPSLSSGKVYPITQERQPKTDADNEFRW